jgi:hypothetical protein
LAPLAGGRLAVIGRVGGGGGYVRWVGLSPDLFLLLSMVFWFWGRLERRPATPVGRRV